ncbi:MAG TPA: class I SAM-dependent methyltransferase [Bacillota bacterium]
MDKTLKTIEGYNQCANAFAEEFMDLGVFTEYVQEFSDLLREGASILDLGCGPGNIGRFLMSQNKAYKILGLDLSAEMLQLAEKHVPGGRFVSADLRYLSLQDKFDAIVASFCIIHLEKSDAFHLLKKTFQLLNDGGYLYLSFMSGGKPGFERTSFSQEEIYFNYFSPRRILKYLKRLGYRIITKHYHAYQRTTNQIIQDVVIIACR